MTVSTVGELRRLHVASTSSAVVHHPSCARARWCRRTATVVIGDDARYWSGELRPCELCRPIVPHPAAPAGEPGWRHALGARPVAAAPPSLGGEPGMPMASRRVLSLSPALHAADGP